MNIFLQIILYVLLFYPKVLIKIYVQILSFIKYTRKSIRNSREDTARFHPKSVKNYVKLYCLPTLLNLAIIVVNNLIHSTNLSVFYWLYLDNTHWTLFYIRNQYKNFSMFFKCHVIYLNFLTLLGNFHNN